MAAPSAAAGLPGQAAFEVGVRVAGLLLELLRVVEQLSVPVVEVWVLAAAALDGGVRERGLGVVDVVDQGDLAAGEVGVLAQIAMLAWRAMFGPCPEASSFAAWALIARARSRIRS